MAINYYRTILGVGVSLMTMQLIIGLGIKYLQDLFTATGQTLDAPLGDSYDCVHHPCGRRAPSPANGGRHGGGRRP